MGVQVRFLSLRRLEHKGLRHHGVSPSSFPSRLGHFGNTVAFTLQIRCLLEATMASLELRRKTYRVVFMYAGRKHGYSLDTDNASTAEASAAASKRRLCSSSKGRLRFPKMPISLRS